MYSIFYSLFFIALLTNPHNALASKAIPDSVRTAITHAMKGSPVGEITPNKQIPGLYEVQTGNNIVYVTADGRYIFFGIILDTKSSINITAARMVELHKQKLQNSSRKKLPRSLSFSIGHKKGNGKSIFVDMTQHESRVVIRRALKSDIKFDIYMLPMSLTNPLADDMATAIWCSKNRPRALQQASERKPIIGKRRRDCKAPIQAWRDLSAQIGIEGPPTAIRRSGDIDLLTTDKPLPWHGLIRNTSAYQANEQMP